MQVRLRLGNLFDYPSWLICNSFQTWLSIVELENAYLLICRLGWERASITISAPIIINRGTTQMSIAGEGRAGHTNCNCKWRQELPESVITSRGNEASVAATELVFGLEIMQIGRDAPKPLCVFVVLSLRFGAALCLLYYTSSYSWAASDDATMAMIMTRRFLQEKSTLPHSASNGKQNANQWRRGK